MRILINIDDVPDPDRPGKKTVRVRTGYMFGGRDQVRTMNFGVQIYGIIKEAFNRGCKGGVVIHEGQRK